MPSKPGRTGTAIDLFCGAGGFSLGARLAGFDVVGSVDVDRDLTSSYTRNFPGSNLIVADLAATAPAELNALVGAADRVDVLVGGPPCQGFSIIGGRQKLDVRNELLVHYFRHVAFIKPRCFVMENVPGLLEFGGRELLEAGLSLLGDAYTVVGPIIVDAADFGAATKRRRVLVVGFDPSEVSPFTASDLQALATRSPASVREAIADLPEPRLALDPRSMGWWKYDGRHSRLSTYAQAARTPPPSGIGCASAVAELAAGRVSGLHATQHSPSVCARFAATPNGAEDSVSRYPRLDWTKQSRTLRAGTGSERGSFQSMRPIHPSKPRVITVREGARLQGFPDWFLFHRTKWHSFRMIGNSVSPLLAEATLGFLKEKLGLADVAQREAQPSCAPLAGDRVMRATAGEGPVLDRRAA